MGRGPGIIRGHGVASRATGAGLATPVGIHPCPGRGKGARLGSDQAQPTLVQWWVYRLDGLYGRWIGSSGTTISMGSGRTAALHGFGIGDGRSSAHTTCPVGLAAAGSNWPAVSRKPECAFVNEDAGIRVLTRAGPIACIATDVKGRLSCAVPKQTLQSGAGPMTGGAETYICPGATMNCREPIVPKRSGQSPGRLGGLFHRCISPHEQERASSRRPCR